MLNIVVKETKNGLMISCLMAHKEENKGLYIHLGCSTHISSKEELFTRIYANYYNKVIFGDNNASRVEGKGALQ